MRKWAEIKRDMRLSRELKQVSRIAKQGHGLGLFGAIMDYESTTNHRRAATSRAVQSVFERYRGEPESIRAIGKIAAGKAKNGGKAENFIYACVVVEASTGMTDKCGKAELLALASRHLEAAETFDEAVFSAAAAARLYADAGAQGAIEIPKAQGLVRECLERAARCIKASFEEHIGLNQGIGAVMNLISTFDSLSEIDPRFGEVARSVSGYLNERWRNLG
jgi:hypothetical protein